MNVRSIVIAHLQSIGADGLCFTDCGCGVDDLFPCACHFSDCVPAKKHSCDHDYCDCNGNACYRPMDTNEPEDTHL